MIDTLGQYKILEPAGAGTLGEVYRARDIAVGRTVAITVVTDQIASNPGRREQFLGQARAAAALSHPNIVTLYEVGDDDDGGLYLVYEFIQGQTLKTIIAGRPLNARRSVDLAGQIAEALADAHAADLVHGAMTADTIVVTPKGHAKIRDFGLATFSQSATATAGRVRSRPGRSPRVSRRLLLARRHSFRDADRQRSRPRRRRAERDQPIAAAGNRFHRGQGPRQERRLRVRGHAGGGAPRSRAPCSTSGRTLTRPRLPSKCRRGDRIPGGLSVVLALAAAAAAAAWWYFRSV